MSNARQTAKLTIVDFTYAYASCVECGNTIKFGGAIRSRTVCAACGCGYAADRNAQTATLDYIPTDEEFWAENDADLY